MNHEAYRSYYTARVDQLENEVMNCCRKLKKLEKTQEMDREQRPLVNCAQIEGHFYWQFDIRQFPIENIKLQVNDRCVLLHAHCEKNDQFLEINRKFQLPDNAQAELSAKIGSNGVLTIKTPLKPT